MLEAVKLAIPVTTDAYDEDLKQLIAAALADLGIPGIRRDLLYKSTKDPLIRRAVITYCKAHFGSPADYDKLCDSYNEQKAQMSMATGYTDWGDADGDC